MKRDKKKTRGGGLLESYKSIRTNCDQEFRKIEEFIKFVDKLLEEYAKGNTGNIFVKTVFQHSKNWPAEKAYLQSSALGRLREACEKLSEVSRKLQSMKDDQNKSIEHMRKIYQHIETVLNLKRLQVNTTINFINTHINLKLHNLWTTFQKYLAAKIETRKNNQGQRSNADSL